MVTSTRTKIALGLLAIAWLALLTALIAVHFTPRSICNEVPWPVGWLTTFWGLIAAGAAAFVAMGIESFAGRSLSTAYVVVGLGLATLFGIWAVGLVWSRHIVTMTACG